MVRKIIIDYRRLPDGGFITKVKGMIIALTGNPDFKDPVPTLAELQDALDAFINAVTAAAEGGKPLKEIKDQERIALAGLVRQLGMFLMFSANGDAKILAGTGYDLTKIPAPKPLGKPGLVKIKDGVSSGMLTVSTRKPQGAKSFLYELSPDPLTPASTWLSIPGSKAKYTFENLVPGKKYWIRIAAVGKDSEVAYSDLYLSQYVQ